MFNLNDTQHESGIILYGDETVGVFNWGWLDNGYIPMVGPYGIVVPWPLDNSDDTELFCIESVDDVHAHLPGTVWMGKDGLETDMEIICDEFGDLPALWGFGDHASHYDDLDCNYSGCVWSIGDSAYKVITIDFWN